MLRSAHALGGLEPREIARAMRTVDVVEAVRAANAAGEAIVPFGGGTRAEIGDPPERYDVALDLRDLRGIVAHEPADLVATVRAGTTLAELADLLRPRGQRWPVEAAMPERATVGGTLASAADGPARMRYFHPRDWVLGVEAVLGDGTLTRAGGRVVKNVTGYDLTKLYGGTYGTLCVLTEVTLKLTALPDAVLTLRYDAADLDAAYREVRALRATHLPVDALAIVIGPPALSIGAPTGFGVFARLAGSARVVARLRAELERVIPWRESGDVWERVAGLPTEAASSVRLTYPAGSLEPHPGDAGGLVYPGVDSAHLFDEQSRDGVSQLRLVLEGKGGAAVLERVPLELRRAAGTWGTPRSNAVVARELKRRFDPNGVLSPGRVPF
ncbi:MAG TPA: FAD-binding oxidoreductase [Candidatus Limnocylindria bacterium]|nr:FAD-binding oxidoreductase [Candidatus Limnocylindria bacterium]